MKRDGPNVEENDDRLPWWQAVIFLILLIAYLWVISTGVINCPR